MCDHCDWKNALDLCETLLQDLDDLPERAEEWAENCDETVRGIQEWIEDNEHVTPKQFETLRKIEASVARWQH